MEWGMDEQMDGWMDRGREGCRQAGREVGMHGGRQGVNVAVVFTVFVQNVRSRVGQCLRGGGGQRPASQPLLEIIDDADVPLQCCDIDRLAQSSHFQSTGWGYTCRESTKVQHLKKFIENGLNIRRFREGEDISEYIKCLESVLNRERKKVSNAKRRKHADHCAMSMSGTRPPPSLTDSDAGIELLNHLTTHNAEALSSIKMPAKVREQLLELDFDDWADMVATTQCSNNVAAALRRLVQAQCSSQYRCARFAQEVLCAGRIVQPYVNAGRLERQICLHCRALLFLGESSAICCGDGKYTAPLIAEPAGGSFLKQLWHGLHDI